jgi:hypothetical protein
MPTCCALPPSGRGAPMSPPWRPRPAANIHGATRDRRLAVADQRDGPIDHARAHWRGRTTKLARARTRAGSGWRQLPRAGSRSSAGTTEVAVARHWHTSIRGSPKPAMRTRQPVTLGAAWFAARRREERGPRVTGQTLRWCAPPGIPVAKGCDRRCAGRNQTARDASRRGRTAPRCVPRETYPRHVDDTSPRSS